MTSDTLLSRARELCKRHRDVPRFCDRCVVETMEAMLVEENPGLAPGDAVELVAAWLRSEGEVQH